LNATTGLARAASPLPSNVPHISILSERNGSRPFLGTSGLATIVSAAAAAPAATDSAFVTTIAAD